MTWVPEGTFRTPVTMSEAQRTGSFIPIRRIYRHSDGIVGQPRPLPAFDIEQLSLPPAKMSPLCGIWRTCAEGGFLLSTIAMRSVMLPCRVGPAPE